MSESYMEHITQDDPTPHVMWFGEETHPGVPTTHHHLTDFMQNAFGDAVGDIHAWLDAKGLNPFMRDLEQKLAQGSSVVSVDEAPGSFRVIQVDIDVTPGYVVRGSDTTRALLIKASPNNTAPVVIGPSPGTTNGGWPLAPGEAISLPTNSNIYGMSTVAGQRMHVAIVSKPE